MERRRAVGFLQSWEFLRQAAKQGGLGLASWRRQWHPTPVLLPGKSHGQRNLVGCSPRGRWESDMTERLHFHFSLSCIGEGNGNPLQCSCLENTRDRGAWWAAIDGVTQSRTRLKRLSSSSSIEFNIDSSNENFSRSYFRFSISFDIICAMLYVGQGFIL